MVLDLEDFKRLVSAELVVKPPPAVTKKRENEWTTEIKYLGVTADSKHTKHKSLVFCAMQTAARDESILFECILFEKKFSTADIHLALSPFFEQYDPISNIFPCPRVLLPR
jgi:hypothetical protein